MNRSARAVGVTVAFLAQLACGPRVTFSEHIAPILRDKCQSCHRPGELAPFPLVTYAQVRTLAPVIRTSVAIGNMPPFYANGPHGYWKDDIRLTDEERQQLLEWADNGAPEGDPSLLPAPEDWPDSDWPLGEPDMVLRFPPHSPPRNGRDHIVTLYTDRPLTEDLWARAIQLKTDSKHAIHHSTVFLIDEDVDVPANLKSLDHRGTEPKNSLFTWFPGLTIDPQPEGQAIRLPAGKRIAARTHFGPTRERLRENLELGIYFADGRVDRVQKQLGLQFIKQINIPPGAGDYTLSGKRRFREDAQLSHFRVHMHLRGKASRVTLHYPDGSSQLVFDLPRYRFFWQRYYYLAEPLHVPKGTVAEFTAVWDNSDQNPLNPDPSAWCSWGQRTTDEMFGAGIFYTSEKRMAKPVMVENGHAL